MKTKLLLALTSLACLTVVQAQTVFQPADGYSSAGSLSGRGIEFAINGDGLSGEGDILSQTHTTSAQNSGFYFIGAKGSDLYFDLGSEQTIDTVWIWQYVRTGATSRGIAGFDISFSNDVNWTSLIAGTGDGGATYTAPATTVTGFLEVPYTSNDTAIAVQSQSLTSESGRYIRLQNVTNHGDGTYTAFGEIRFGVVPEPSSFALLSGMLALGWVMLRRRS